MIKLEDITTPEFLRSLSYEELDQLAADIRQFLIESVSKTGGHLSSNLGTIEMTIALHYVFGNPNDKLVFDVGHQTYTHKILTGRADKFDTLREKDGLSGFLKYDESPYDVWEAGHSSTSISAASGFLEAKSMGADIGEVVAIIGDGSIQNGLSLSALNYLGSRKDQKVIIILNDNNMSISKNVGSLAKIFNQIRLKKSYQFVKRITPNFVDNMLKNAKGAFKSFVYGNNLMAAVGFRYFGPINGHSIKCLIKYFEHAKKSDQSIIIHAKTIKGKGYKFSEEDQVGIWHGIGPFDIETGKQHKKTPEGKISWSNGFGELILNEAKANKKIKVISSAMIVGSGLDKFTKELPDQIVDVGIAEEHSVVMASAMSRYDVIPVVSIYSTFLQRAYDELNHDVARTNAHVVFLIDRAGIVGADGSTHQGTFDISYLSHLPNMVIAMPKDLNEAYSLLKFALYEYKGPFAIRYPRGNTDKQELLDQKIEFGSWEIIKEINDINIITYGPVVNKFSTLIEEENKQLGLINARYIKPLDLNTLRKLSGKKIVIYEEVVIKGSLSSMILEENLKHKLNIDIEIIGIDDKFVKHGKVKSVKKDLGLDIRDIIKKY